VRNQPFTRPAIVPLSASNSSADKGKYVQLTEEEIESLEAEANSTIDLKEFIPINSVDPIYFEHGYYLDYSLQTPF
jgi:DNA end-binding protein Ku